MAKGMRANLLTAALLLVLFFMFCSQTPPVKSAMAKRDLKKAIRQRRAQIKRHRARRA